MDEITVDGFGLGVDAEDFMTPHWTMVWDAYPAYKAHCLASKDSNPPLPFAGFTCAVAKELEMKCTRGRSSDEWLERCIEHFGLAHMERVKERLSA